MKHKIQQKTITSTIKICFVKRYSKIDQQLARYFVYFVECLLNPPPFLCSQIIIPFISSMISTNHEKGGIQFEQPGSFKKVKKFMQEKTTLQKSKNTKVKV